MVSPSIARSRQVSAFDAAFDAAFMAFGAALMAFGAAFMAFGAAFMAFDAAFMAFDPAFWSRLVSVGLGRSRRFRDHQKLTRDCLADTPG